MAFVVSLQLKNVGRGQLEERNETNQERIDRLCSTLCDIAMIMYSISMERATRRTKHKKGKIRLTQYVCIAPLQGSKNFIMIFFNTSLCFSI